NRDCPNIIGVKESNKDFEHVNRVLLNCGRDFMLFSGIELLCYPMLAIGGSGSISATSNVAPAKVAEMHNAWNEGDFKRAQDLQNKLILHNDVLFKATNLISAKAAPGMIGKIDLTIRLTMDVQTTELQEENQDVLKNYYAESELKAFVTP